MKNDLNRLAKYEEKTEPNLIDIKIFINSFHFFFKTGKCIYQSFNSYQFNDT